MIMSTFPVMQELRPYLEEATYLEIVQDMQTKGYNLVGAFLDNTCVGVAGYRFLHMLLLSGRKHLYVDDLVVQSDMRSKSIGKKLIAWLEATAREEGCIEIILDSGHQRTRAHRFYEREQYISTAQHFRKVL